MDLTEWLQQIEQTVAVGDRFFTSQNTGLFDAMPAFWQRLSEEARHECVRKITRFHADFQEGETVWCSENVKQLRSYCDLDHRHLLRACYLVVK